MYQKIVLVGNLGQDPELRYTEAGKAVANFSIATSRRWTGADGQAQEETTWFRVAVWGNMAEACAKYLKKGRQVLVEGRLMIDRETGGPRIWTDQDGNARANFEVTAVEVKFLGSSGGQVEAKTESEDTDTEGEIPF